MSEDLRIALARKLFAAWSSGDADAPAAFLAPDAELYDVVAGHRFEGWPAIRTFFADGAKQWPDLAFEMLDFWTNDRGVAAKWVMAATVADDRFGPETRGKRWRAEGMSELVISGDRVTHETDIWNGAQIMSSLGIAPRRREAN